RGKALECAARRVAPCTAKPALTAEDFVVGEHAIAGEISASRRNDEAAIENSDGQARRRNPIVIQQLVESLRLAGVIAEDDRRNSIGCDLLQALYVALNLFRLPERKCHLRIVVRQIDASQCVQRAHRGVGRLEQLVTARSVLSASPREINVVLSLGPGSLQLGPHVSSSRNDEQRVGWK